MDENDSTRKMSDFKDLNTLKKTLLFLGMSTLQYSDTSANEDNSFQNHIR